MKRKPAAIFILSLGLVAVALFWWFTRDSNQESVSETYRELDALFLSPQGCSCDLKPGEKFRSLLTSKTGRKQIRKLADKHESIVFDEKRHAVYYTHQRSQRPGKSCIGTVIADPDAELPLVGHAGISRYLSANSLSLDNDVLSVRCQASIEEEHRNIIGNSGLIPGEEYEGLIDLDKLRGDHIAFSDFLTFRPVKK